VPADSPATNKSQVLRFGAFEADLVTRELRKEGSRLRIQEQPFSVLATLIARPGAIVTREELRSELWPADTFVDFDHSLNTAVNKLREVLGDSATEPRFIETVARRGYRFVGELQREEPSAAVIPSNGVPDAGAPEHDLPRPHRGLTRGMFGLIQVMYLAFYVAALLHVDDIYGMNWPNLGVPAIFIAVLVTAAVGIPLRFYLLSGVAFDYGRLGEKFHRIFLGVLLLDQLWAIAPFLLLAQIGFGPALGATAALLYVPFAERTLIRMSYPSLSNDRR